ncbi:MAG: hypothetical protein J0I86_19260, partial [Mesorhizobium sp.]|nr:hypothetical protein [Mesorhizobium sp.]
MNDKVDRDDWRHERSLAELGRAMRGDDEVPQSAGSLLSLAQSTAPDWRDNAVERHQIARTRREAIAERDTAPIASIPPLEEPRPDVSATPEMPDNGPQTAADQSPASSWLPRWAQPGAGGGTRDDALAGHHRGGLDCVCHQARRLRRACALAAEPAHAPRGRRAHGGAA